VPSGHDLPGSVRLGAQAPCNFRAAWDIHLVPAIARCRRPASGFSHPNYRTRWGGGQALGFAGSRNAIRHVRAATRQGCRARAGVRTQRAVFTNAELMAQDQTVRWPEAG
jgi:hypothetical protein